jgi:hypothetical protein
MESVKAQINNTNRLSLHTWVGMRLGADSGVAHALVIDILTHPGGLGCRWGAALRGFE